VNSVPPRTVLITGATDGIGLLLAQKYASIGCKVLATGRKPDVEFPEKKGGSNITYLRADQSAPQRSALAIVRAMDELGWKGCDLAILNAGVGWTGDPVDEPASEIEAQILINLRAPIQIAHAVAPRLLSAQGQLVFIGSTAHKGAASFATYSATKAGLRGVARSLHEEWRGRAKVQIIHPGPVRTSMHSKAGLKVGLARMLFANPKRAANAIMAATLKSQWELNLSFLKTRFGAWRIPRRLRR